MRSIQSVFDPSHWLRALKQPYRPRARLLCLPYAGGAASLFHAWSMLLPGDIELRAAQLPARQDRSREPPMTNVDVIVDHLASAMAQLPRLPTAIFGHSFGGLLAYELTRRLHASGSAPFALIASARRAPQLPCAHPTLHKVPDAEFLAGLNRYCHTPWETLRNKELMELAMPALRADFEALETYAHSAAAPLDVPTVVLRGRCDSSVSEESALAWREVLTGKPTLHELDADHFFVDTHRTWVVERVNEVLAGWRAAFEQGTSDGAVSRSESRHPARTSGA